MGRWFPCSCLTASVEAGHTIVRIMGRYVSGAGIPSGRGSHICGPQREKQYRQPESHWRRGVRRAAPFRNGAYNNYSNLEGER